MVSRFTELCVDSANPRQLAGFWAEVLGWRIENEADDDDEIELVDPDGGKPTLLFIRVPESKTVKNRLHIDVNARDREQSEEVERLLGLGATLADVGQGDDVTWVVMADPEGNEFCVLRSRVD
jgi:predicted enzyme related to lactoylglutathione lyase